MEDKLYLKREWFIQRVEGKISDHYEGFDKKYILGQGAFSKVIKVVHRSTKNVRACKIIPKHKVEDSEKFKTEIEILQSVDHPSIIKLYEIYEDMANIFLVMELCTGGELFDRILKIDHFDEIKARKLFKQIVGAINYLHKKELCHRDIKAENFLFLDNSDDLTLKLIDFGLSTKFAVENTHFAKNKIDDNFFPQSKSKKFHSKVGTSYYIAPEVLDGNYDEKCDIWGVGVLLYIILVGYPPFFGNTDREILKRVRLYQYDFDRPEWEKVSDHAKDLISNILKPSDKRYTLAQVYAHPWMNEKIKTSVSL